MNRARIVVLTVAICAGGVAAYLASGSDKSAPPPAPVAQLPTVDVLVAKNDIGLGQTVKPEDVQWQTWPAATAAPVLYLRNATGTRRLQKQRPRRSGAFAVVRRSLTSATC
jgi:pilus assembly protein CpaB